MLTQPAITMKAQFLSLFFFSAALTVGVSGTGSTHDEASAARDTAKPEAATCEEQPAPLVSVRNDKRAARSTDGLTSWSTLLFM